MRMSCARSFSGAGSLLRRDHHVCQFLRCPRRGLCCQWIAAELGAVRLGPARHLAEHLLASSLGQLAHLCVRVGFSASYMDAKHWCMKGSSRISRRSIGE